MREGEGEGGRDSEQVVLISVVIAYGNNRVGSVSGCRRHKQDWWGGVLGG